MARETDAYIEKRVQTGLEYRVSIRQAACKQGRLEIAEQVAVCHRPKRRHIPQCARDQLDGRELPASYRQ